MCSELIDLVEQVAVRQVLKQLDHEVPVVLVTKHHLIMLLMQEQLDKLEVKMLGLFLFLPHSQKKISRMKKKTHNKLILILENMKIKNKKLITKSASSMTKESRLFLIIIFPAFRC